MSRGAGDAAAKMAATAPRPVPAFRAHATQAVERVPPSPVRTAASLRRREDQPE